MSRCLLSCALLALLVAPAAADGEDAGHVHGPDGRHIAGVEAGTDSTGTRILSHHDLLITDTSLPRERAVVDGCEVQSVIHRKGDPGAVVHRERNAFEAQVGVYGAHFTYREPGEYVIVEQITMPDGKQYTLAFPIWVPGPKPAGETGGLSPLVLAAATAGGLLLLGLAFHLGRRDGRRVAAGLLVPGLLGGLAPGNARAHGDEPGHAHGPDGRHIAAAASVGAAPAAPLRAYLGPNGELELTQTRDRFRFRLTIENEVLQPDLEVVSLDPAAAEAIGLETAPAARRALAGGLSTTGQVRPHPDGLATVNSRVAGRVLRMYVSPGESVATGAVIAVIDSTEVAQAQGDLTRAESERRQAAAARARARAEGRHARALAAESEAALGRMQARHAETRAEVARAESDLEAARGRAVSARQALERQQRLAAAGAFAQGPVEAARSALAAAEGELRSAETAQANLDAQARRLEQGVRDGVAARRDAEAAQAAAAQGRTRVTTAARQLEIARAALAREERIQRESLRDAQEIQQAQAEAQAAQLAERAAEAGVTRQMRAADAAAAEVIGGRRAVQAAAARVEAVDSEVREADARADGARRAVQAALDRLRLLGARPGAGNHVAIAAPIGGHVHNRLVNTGQAIAAGEPLATVINTASVWVEGNVFERDLPRVRLGQRVSVGADAVPGHTFEGTITYVGPDVDAETRAVRVRTVIANPRGLLKPNMFVRVVIAGAPGEAVLVPTAAVQEHLGEQVVFVVEAAGTYRRRSVRVGPALGDRVVIEAGLKPGERVVTRGSYQLLARLRG